MDAAGAPLGELEMFHTIKEATVEIAAAIMVIGSIILIAALYLEVSGP